MLQYSREIEAPASPRPAYSKDRSGRSVSSVASTCSETIPGFFSVILPAFNEGHIIQRTLEELTAVLELSVEDHEVIVVDDGSSDNTFAAASAYAVADSRVSVVSYPENQGKGYALRKGFEESRGDTVVFFDADLDIPPWCIRVLLEQLQEDGLGGVVGSKMHKDSQVHYTVKRRILSHAVRIFVWTLFQISIKDTQVGLKVFRREVLEQIMALPRVNGFAFDIELLALARKSGAKIGEGPVCIEYVQQASTVTLRSVFRALTDAFGIFYRIRIKQTRLKGGN
jgi:glycosyltransferase involved in cell wall biosynthesis